MLDFETYKELHPSNSYFSKLGDDDYVRVKQKPNLPTDDSPPQSPEIYLFPPRIPGFDLRRKKWGEDLPLHVSS